MKSVFNPFQRCYRRDLPHRSRGLLMWWRIEIPCFARDFIKVFEVVKYFYYLVFPITRRHLFLDNFSSGSRSPFRPAAITFLIYELPPAKLKILTLQSNMIVSLFPSHFAKKVNSMPVRGELEFSLRQFKLEVALLPLSISLTLSKV